MDEMMFMTGSACSGAAYTMRHQTPPQTTVLYTEIVSRTGFTDQLLMVKAITISHQERSHKCYFVTSYNHNDNFALFSASFSSCSRPLTRL